LELSAGLSARCASLEMTRCSYLTKNFIAWFTVLMSDWIFVKLRVTGILLALDAAVLFLLGTLLLVLPQHVLFAFGFVDLPLGVTYVIALWGCALLTMAIGYWKASADPVRHLVWVQVGIARGALEFAVGIVYLLRGIVSFRQAGLGIILAGLFALAYLLFYPRAQT
jgi:hypothetical protein